MLKLGRYKRFDWDKGNVDKSYQKHGIIPNEAEEVFLDEKAIIIRDIKHSQKEERLILLGETTGRKLLFIVFTLRGTKIRIISARKANEKEREQYE
ncbi:MAG: hypothetical protein A2784_01560 [Candidatus Chisholmbacteria bacterium RIFCSPHIGHO2_01_FULL_48_12]|uniref:Toxin n=1 Tax=Candidatus Chisholmbacteria bacterium RIFCSPHIGHO2_01_FULL_48_12 TaxID=1797589 RepID=A0A1G1VK80_9BACT|nr:MAG: hypothetical protein A2784_01560 [Candidatus Chisholmbacteria bacterium RIFCSPHIGHO2_01_FULL_48_12]